jgi:hypothetical protein
MQDQKQSSVTNSNVALIHITELNWTAQIFASASVEEAEDYFQRKGQWERGHLRINGLCLSSPYALLSSYQETLAAMGIDCVEWTFVRGDVPTGSPALEPTPGIRDRETLVGVI